ncbi:MAG TPA: SelB C-terminal domain-containing protein, partial [Candidatus Limnocylindrales bacterium]|nr:SelB C-terminal domain-containing protein [Candidatus Limnocylindrales bacterium]
AHLTLPDGTELDFVDVPGHDRLVGNMLVGAGEIDAAMLVIAADDGPRAQTREHLELLDALGIDDGLIVVTKSDVAGPERVAEVVAAAGALVASTTLGGVPVLAVSATTGEGLAALVTALVDLRDRIAIRSAGDIPDAGSRLAIDRAFSIRGRGTVVTGTLRGTPIERGTLLRVVPGPADRSIRVREVQIHGRAVDRAGPGRVALNVAGDGVDGLGRGAVLTTDPRVVASDRWLVALRRATAFGAGTASAAGRGPGLPADRTRIAVHLGTARVAGVVGRSGRDGVDLDGGEGSAILRLDRPIAVAPGDRFVVRRPSPVETLAGGRVLDPQPARGIARRRTTVERLRALATAGAGSDAWRSARAELHGVVLDSSPGIAPDVAAAIDDVLLAAVEGRPGIRISELVRAGEVELRRRVGTIGPPGAAAGDAAHRIVAGRLDDLIGADRLSRDADRVRPAGVAAVGPSPALATAMDRLVAALSTVSPPPLTSAARAAGCPPEGIRLLEQANRIVRLDDDLAWAFPAWRDLAARAIELARGGPLTPAAYRDATGTSRKYVMALLEDLDRRAILRRTPAGHVPGPRAPQLAAADAASPAGAPR